MSITVRDVGREPTYEDYIKAREKLHSPGLDIWLAAIMNKEINEEYIMQ